MTSTSLPRPRPGSLRLIRTTDRAGAGKVKLVLELGGLTPFQPVEVGITVTLDVSDLTSLWSKCLAGQDGVLEIAGEASVAQDQETRTRRREAMGPAELTAELADHRAKIVAKLAGAGSLDEVLMLANSIRSLGLELHRRGLPWQ